MTVDSHQSGMQNILDAVHSGLVERHVEGARVEQEARADEAHSLIVTITVGDKSSSKSFSTAEIDDCRRAIDAPAALKVRMLVSEFVR